MKNCNYAILKNGVVENFRMCEDHIKNLGLPADRYIQYNRVAPPADTMTNKFTEVEPILIDGVWTQQYIESALELPGVQIKIKNNVNARVTKLIDEHYSSDKINSDVIDKEYALSALMMITAKSSDALVLETSTHVNNIFDVPGTLLTDVVTTYPEIEQYFWNELIKAGIRVAYVSRIKKEYKFFLIQLEAATDIQECLDLYAALGTLPFPTI